MKNENGEALSEGVETVMKRNEDQSDELTVRLAGLLKVDAKGRSAIRAVADPIRLLVVALAIAILAVSTGHTVLKFVWTTAQWSLDLFHH
jgi:hypothetical protein